MSLRLKGEMADEGKIRSQALAEIESFSCTVMPATAAKSGISYKDFPGTLSDTDTQKAQAYAQALKASGVQFAAYLRTLQNLPEDAKEVPPAPVMPPMPAIANPGLDTFNALSAAEQNAVRDGLKAQALKSFSCSGGGAGACVKSVSYENENVFTNDAMNERSYRISAVPQCTFQAK